MENSVLCPSALGEVPFDLLLLKSLLPELGPNSKHCGESQEMCVNCIYDRRPFVRQHLCAVNESDDC